MDHLAALAVKETGEVPVALLPRVQAPEDLPEEEAEHQLADEPEQDLGRMRLERAVHDEDVRVLLDALGQLTARGPVAADVVRPADDKKEQREDERPLQVAQDVAHAGHPVAAAGHLEGAVCQPQHQAHRLSSGDYEWWARME